MNLRSEAGGQLGRSSNKLPAYTCDSRSFWTAGERKQLVINYCGDCGRYHHPPAPICHFCLSRSVMPTPVSGRGEIMSFTVNYQAWQPDMAVPFVVAYVALAEQPDIWLLTNIVGCEIADISMGMRVGVRFDQQEEVFVPLFAPLSETER